MSNLSRAESRARRFVQGGSCAQWVWVVSAALLLPLPKPQGTSDVVTTPARTPAAPPATRDEPPPLVLEEKPEWLVPAKPRTEAQQDRLEALSLFSAARLRENRQDYRGALRLYQRAFRSDPQSASIAQSIVPLAARLGRHAEALRYALKLADIEQLDPQLLKRLGVYLTEIGEWSQALALYEKASQARSQAKPAGEDVVLWTEMGRLYHLTHQPAKAAACFARVLEALDKPQQYGFDDAVKRALLAKPRALYSLMGESFLAAGQPEKAAAAFEKSQQAAPSKGLLGYHRAKIDLKTGKPDKALEHLQAYFDERLSSEELGPYLLLADALKALGKQGEIIPRLEQLCSADPNNVWLGYSLAEKYLEAAQLDKAEKLYRDLMAKKPMVAGYPGLAQIYRKTNRYDDLLQAVADAVGKLGTLEPLAPKQRPLAEDAELVKGVVEAARKRLAKNPKELAYPARLGVAVLAADAKQHDVAGEFFDLAIQAQPDQAGRLLMTWGLGLLLSDQHARAIKVFQRGIDEKALPAGDPAFHYYLAGALEMAGQTEPALAAARKAAELAASRQAAKSTPQKNEPPEELARCLGRVAWILYHAKRHDEAAKQYRQLVEKFGNDYRFPETRRAVREARLVLSNLAVLKGDLPGAEEWLQQVLDEFPDDPSASNDLGYLWADEGKHLDRAHRMIRHAVDQEPDNAAYRDSLGWVLFRKGKVREALPELEKAAAIEPDPTVLEHLADAYQADGQRDKAISWWRKAAEAYRKVHDDEKAKKVEQKIKAPP